MRPDQLDAILEPEMLAMQTYCLEKGWYLSESLLDRNCSWSQQFHQRPQGKLLLNRLEPGDVVLVSKLERIASSSQEALQLIRRLRERRVQLHVVELRGDATDVDVTLGLEQAGELFSGLEKRKSTERIKSVKQRQRKQGRYLGGSRPFGYMIHENGRLVEDPNEQRVLKEIVDLKKQGKSLRAISNEVSTPLVPISFKTVQRLLQRHADQL